TGTLSRRSCRLVTTYPAQLRRSGSAPAGGGRRHLQAQLGESRVVGRPRPGAVPVEEPVGGVDRDVVDARVSLTHEAVLVELPVLVAVRAEPLAVDVVGLVDEPHGDPVVAVGDRKSVV